MKDTGREPFRFLVQVLSRCAAVLGTTLVSILVSRHLGANGRGNLAICQSAVGVGTPLLGFSLSVTNTFCAAKYPQKLGQLLANSWVAVALAALLVALTSPLWSGPLVGHTQLWLVSNILMVLMTCLALGRGKIAFVNRVEIAYNSLYLLALGWLWQHQQLTLSAVLLGRALVASLSGLTTFWRLRSECEDPMRWNFDLVRQHFRYGLAGYVLSLIAQLNANLAVITVGQQCTKEIMGQFAVALQIGSLLKLMADSFTGVLFPQCIALPNQSARRQRMRFVLPISGLLIGAAAIGLGFLSNYLVVPIFGAPFQSSIALLWMMLPGSWFLCMEQLSSVLISATEIPLTYVLICSTSALVNGSLCYLLVSRWGASGGAMAFTIAASLLCLASVSYAWRYENAQEAQKSTLVSPSP